MTQRRRCGSPRKLARRWLATSTPKGSRNSGSRSESSPFFVWCGLSSQNEVDTCLKLMVLHELTRVGGRWSLERIRSHTRFLDPSRVEALVRSLKGGGCLDLREMDHTYALSPHGVHLLSVLHAADFGNLGPANALARAAQNAAFGATLDGS